MHGGNSMKGDVVAVYRPATAAAESVQGSTMPGVFPCRRARRRMYGGRYRAR
jgi:hypothetical protein